MNGFKSPTKFFALVVWDDAHGNSSDDKFESDIIHSAERYNSYGWVIRSDSVGITLASEWCQASGSWRSTMFIPRGMVVEELLVTMSKKSKKRERKAAPEKLDAASILESDGSKA